MRTAYILHDFVALARQHLDPRATADTVRAQLKAKGSAYGVTPRKSPSGHWLFPLRETYIALGLLPPAREVVVAMRDQLAAQGIDPFSAHQCVEAQLSRRPHGDAPRQRIENIKLEVRWFEAQLSALRDRVAAAFFDEEHVTDAEWKEFRKQREALIHALDIATMPLGWRDC